MSDAERPWPQRKSFFRDHSARYHEKWSGKVGLLKHYGEPLRFVIHPQIYEKLEHFEIIA